MNKLIKLFAEKADPAYTGIDGICCGDCLIGNDVIQKFAESIIAECAGITLDFKNDEHYTGWTDHSAEILKHFGITK